MDLNSGNFARTATGLLIPGQPSTAPSPVGLITDLSGVDLEALGLHF